MDRLPTELLAVIWAYVPFLQQPFDRRTHNLSRLPLPAVRKYIAYTTDTVTWTRGQCMDLLSRRIDILSDPLQAFQALQLLNAVDDEWIGTLLLKFERADMDYRHVVNEARQPLWTHDVTTRIGHESIAKRHLAYPIDLEPADSPGMRYFVSSLSSRLPVAMAMIDMEPFASSTRSWKTHCLAASIVRGTASAVKGILERVEASSPESIDRVLLRDRLADRLDDGCLYADVQTFAYLLYSPLVDVWALDVHAWHHVKEISEWAHGIPSALPVPVAAAEAFVWDHVTCRDDGWHARHAGDTGAILVNLGIGVRDHVRAIERRQREANGTLSAERGKRVWKRYLDAGGKLDDLSLRNRALVEGSGAKLIRHLRGMMGGG
ncbi:hypothetical protein HKX48_006285 [Thoreauomyces humboldtii]|nr:hypothetical protein HKX48_006285 [Thoreauomyces humboldtii]